MKKWYVYLILALVWSCALFGFSAECVLADDVHEGVFDDAGLLTEEEKAEISSRIRTLEQENQIHVLVVTTEDTQGKETMAYADDFFEEHNEDGTSGAGLLFLIDKQHSELYISTSGDEIIQIFTDERLESILDGVYDKAVDGDFYGSCQQFLEGVNNVFSGSANGAESMTDNAGTRSESTLVTVGRIFDDAGLLTENEIKKLEEKVSDLESKAGFRILITTTNSTDGRSSRDYAENFFKSHNDHGRQNEGIVYLINMEAREIYVYASGDQVLESFSQANVEKMLDRIYKRVADGEFYKSCSVFLKNVSRYGVNSANRLNLIKVLLCLIVSLLIGGVIVFLISRNRGGKVVAGANNYFVADGANELLRQDTFVNRTVSRRKIKIEDKGGSSVHRSSSGTLHGGSSRSFGGGGRGGGRKF